MKKTILSIFTLILTLGLVTTVYAQEGSRGNKPETRSNPVIDRESKKAEMEESREERQAEMQATKEEREASREEKMLARCEVIRERVQARVNQFEENKGVHVENYNRVVTRLEEIIASLSEQGYDTTELSGALETWKVMIADYAAAYTEFIATLDSSSDTACGESDGEYKGLLDQARNQHKIALELRQKARDFYAHDLREAIQNLRDQAKDMTEEDTEEEETEETENSETEE